MSRHLLIDGPDAAKATVVLAHGAGAPMDSPFMQTVAAGLAAAGLRVVRFEFPYMQRRREEGSRRGPDRGPVLEQTWRDVLAELAVRPVVIGGKSMGGRIASMVADAAGVDGLLCLGYPFHPAGDSGKLRVEHLRTLRTPALILQGERDSMGTRDQVTGYELSPSIEVRYLPDGDHSFKPRKASGRTADQNVAQAIQWAARWIGQITRDGCE